MKTWEVNGNIKSDCMDLILPDVQKLKYLFDKLFGFKLMCRYDLFVDNSTCDSCHTPITIPVLHKYFIIKLGISTDSHAARVVYQFAHELTHFLYYCKYGIDKPFATQEEETICTAISLICVNYFYPHMLAPYIESTLKEEKEEYRNGVPLAQKYDFDINSLESIIDNYKVFILEEQYYDLEIQEQNS